MGHLFVGLRYDGLSGKCCFGIMYVKWYGVSNVVVISVVEVCVDYRSVYVFHVCFHFCAVDGVVICVDVCRGCCIVECCLFLESGCCLLCCYVL